MQRGIGFHVLYGAHLEASVLALGKQIASFFKVSVPKIGTPKTDATHRAGVETPDLQFAVFYVIGC